jgi:hypothetical protein
MGELTYKGFHRFGGKPFASKVQLFTLFTVINNLPRI